MRHKQYQKSGRPKLEPSKLRKVRGLRASDEEWNEWAVKAKAYGYDNVYAWMRAALAAVPADPEGSTNEAA